MVDFLQTRPSLLLRLRDPRDGEAWTQFVDLYAPLVYGHARKYGLQNADAADLSQEVLSAVAGAVGRLEYDPQHGTFRSWLFTIIRRKLSNWRRSRRSHREESVDAEVITACPAPNVDEAAWELEWQKRLFTWA
jgi:RNA polymerase sigma factor (sigma-70 family)